MGSERGEEEGVEREAGGLEPGLQGMIEDIVSSDMTAQSIGSGDVPVLATPIVLALAERAAVAAVAGALPAGTTTVGASVVLSHEAPTPVGTRVVARVRLEDIVGAKRLQFSFTLHDEAGQVAAGTHVRIVVDRARFEAAAKAREIRSDG